VEIDVIEGKELGLGVIGQMPERHHIVGICHRAVADNALRRPRLRVRLRLLILVNSRTAEGVSTETVRVEATIGEPPQRIPKIGDERRKAGDLLFLTRFHG
jgi:hypothetical protein